MKDAVSQSRVLLGAKGEVQNLSVQAATTSQDLQSKVDSAQRLLPTIEQRLNRAEQISLVINRDIAARLETLKTAVVDHDAPSASAREQTQQVMSLVIAEQIGAFEERISDLLKERMNRAGEACDDIFRAAQSKLGGILARVDATLANLATVQRESEDRLGAATATLERVEETRARLERAAGSISESLDKGISQVEARIGDAAAHCESLLATTREQILNLTEHARAVDTRLLDVQHLRATVADAADAITRGTEVSLELRELAARGHAMRQADQANYVQMTETIAQINEVRPKLSVLVQRADLVRRALEAMIQQHTMTTMKAPGRP